MTVEERKPFVRLVFSEIRPTEEGLKFLARDDWKRYMAAVAAALAGVLAERKTGLYIPNVETGRLVRDERGWLRLAG